MLTKISRLFSFCMILCCSSLSKNVNMLPFFWPRCMISMIFCFCLVWFSASLEREREGGGTEVQWAWGTACLGPRGQQASGRAGLGGSSIDPSDKLFVNQSPKILNLVGSDTYLDEVVVSLYSSF